MDFELTSEQSSWQARGSKLGREVRPGAGAQEWIAGAASEGLFDAGTDLLSVVIALEAVATESPPAAAAIALHASVVFAAAERFAELRTGGRVGALVLSSDELPIERGGRISGRASWAAPVAGNGVAVVGVRSGEDVQACAIVLGGDGVAVEPVETSALEGVAYAHLTLADVALIPLGSPAPIMARARLLIAAVGLGLGRRALRDALKAARAAGDFKGTGYGSDRAAAGEQTVQGLLADAATELDAARLLTWRAAGSGSSLAATSMAKLAATSAAQRAVERSTQVVGAESFRRGHIIQRLSQDVRALELFAGRTEALRSALAGEALD
jgi:alkylation response protein AidB-like acyl-CoA dehydrogenase